jgi:hypothetical protein
MDRYPGNSYVDIISMDDYVQPRNLIDLATNTSIYNSNTCTDIIGGLQGLVMLANQLNKVPCLAEYGVNDVGGSFYNYMKDLACQKFWSTTFTEILNNPFTRRLAYIMTWHNNKVCYTPLPQRTLFNSVDYDYTYQTDPDVDLNSFVSYLSFSNPAFGKDIALARPYKYTPVSFRNRQLFSSLNGNRTVLWNHALHNFNQNAANNSRGEIFFAHLWLGPMTIQMSLNDTGNSGNVNIKSLGLKHPGYSNAYVGYITFSTSIPVVNGIMTPSTVTVSSEDFFHDYSNSTIGDYPNISCHPPQPGIGYKWEISFENASDANLDIIIDTSYFAPI